MMAAVLCVTLLSSFSSQDEDNYMELESGHKTQLYGESFESIICKRRILNDKYDGADGGWEDDLEKR